MTRSHPRGHPHGLLAFLAPWLPALLSALAAAFAITLAVSGTARAQPATIELRTGQDEINLPGQAQILEDASGRLTLADLQAGGHGWTAWTEPTISLGFSRSTWWVRVRLHNAEATELARMLEIGSALQDHVDAYLVHPDGRVQQHVATGDRRPFSQRPVATRAPALPLQFTAGQTLDVYLRLGTHDGLHETLPLKLWAPAAYARSQQAENLAFGLYYGALLTVLLYNLFLYASTRQRSFGLYTAYVGAFLAWSFTFRGYAFQYLWPDSPVFNNQFLPIAAAACYCTFGLFMLAYLDTRHSVPRWLHRVLVGATVGNVLCITPAFFNVYALTFALTIPFGVTLMVSAFAAAIWLLRAGSRPARYFVLAFTLLTLGVMLYYARLLGWVPSNIVTENFLQIGSAAEVILLAFGLADQMNQLRAGKLRAERSALEAQRALNEELERLVRQRTQALEAANLRLADMSITDELTGVANRRHFNAMFEADLARHQRSHAPFALCLFDIDHFKLYNDRYGHPAGDHVLQRVAEVVRQRLRRAGDQIFRVGGEEFALLFNVDEPPVKVAPLVEQIRADIEALHIAHAGSPLGVVTASFGLITLSGLDAAGQEPADVPTPQAVYKRADELLYAAKRHGRNRLVTTSWHATGGDGASSAGAAEAAARASS